MSDRWCDIWKIKSWSNNASECLFYLVNLNSILHLFGFCRLIAWMPVVNWRLILSNYHMKRFLKLAGLSLSIRKVLTTMYPYFLQVRFIKVPCQQLYGSRVFGTDVTNIIFTWLQFSSSIICCVLSSRSVSELLPGGQSDRSVCQDPKQYRGAGCVHQTDGVLTWTEHDREQHRVAETHP